MSLSRAFWKGFDPPDGGSEQRPKDVFGRDPADPGSGHATVHSSPAPIPAVVASVDRPFLSVMIPTWRPVPEYLERAIRSVLDQLDPSWRIQLEIVDDCSTNFDPSAFAARFGQSAVSFHRHDRHLGLAGNWNACLARARGHWVHLLHQDDFVLPGFYQAFLQGIDHDRSVAAAFCASYFADANGAGWAPTLLPMNGPGILDDCLRHVFVRLSIQCSAMIVRRDVYETLGGFDAGFSYALDWDMWKRLAVRYPIWYDPQPLACYRMHSASETSRQRLAGTHLVEVFRSIKHSAAYLPQPVAARITRRARAHYAVFAVESALDLIRVTGAWGPALYHLNIARQESSVAAVIAALAKVTIRGGFRALRGDRRTNLTPISAASRNK
jgi:GT2 family glycosyltransferase